MTAHFNHTIIASADSTEMAHFYGYLLDPSGHYLELITRPSL